MLYTGVRKRISENTFHLVNTGVDPGDWDPFLESPGNLFAPAKPSQNREKFPGLSRNGHLGRFGRAPKNLIEKKTLENK